ncbi:MAG TPA: carboxypeptidase-like regulatory domain-containing protein [Myxococcota bacterium]|nr:carboxypeptidase-like regulatory domain-containing protein [Myxococcota bacterium]
MTAAARLLAACGAALIFFSACELTDEIYHQGQGAVHGATVVSGAEVNWVGASFTTLPAVSDDAGEFFLTDVPAGRRELMIRAPEHSLGLRIFVTIVAGQTSELGTLELDNAPPLAVTVRDPDLGINGVRLRLMEIPGLEVTSDSSGAAEFPCVPRSGCYTIKADATPYPFVFSSHYCPQSPADWQAGLLLVPEQSDELLLAQVHNAYATLQEVLDPLTDCESECFVPDSWLQQNGPPCPWPLGDIHETDEDFLKHLDENVNRLSKLQRFGESKWAGLSCPMPGAYGSTCSQDRCLPASLVGVGSATVMKSDTAPNACFPDKTELVMTIEGDPTTLAACLGIDPPPTGGPETYLFVALNAPAWPQQAVITGDGHDYDLYIEAELPIDPKIRGIDPGTRPWALIRIVLPAPAPSDPVIRTHLAWIYPVE